MQNLIFDGWMPHCYVCIQKQLHFMEAYPDTVSLNKTECQNNVQLCIDFINLFQNQILAYTCLTLITKLLFCMC